MKLFLIPLYREMLMAAVATLVAGAAAAILLRRRELQLSARAAWTGVAAGVVLYVLVFAGLSFRKLAAHNMGFMDLGGMDQAIWNTSQGRYFEMTGFNTGNLSRLGIHVEPLFLLVAPVFKLWDDVRALLLLQTLAVALAAFPIFATARIYLGEAGAAVAALAYLLYPALEHANLADFHADTLAVPFVAIALWAYERRRPVLYALAAVLAMSAKEYVPLVFVGLGLYMLSEAKPRWALATLGAGAAWFALAVFVVIPHFAGGPAYYFGEHYASLGGDQGVAGMARKLVTEPMLFVHEVLTPAKIGYLVLVFLPLYFLPLAAPLRLLAAAPILAVVLLHPGVADIRNHHTAVLVPVLFWAGARSVEWLEARYGPSARNAALGAWAAAALAAAIFFGPSPLAWKLWTPGEWQHHAHTHNYRRTFHDALVDEVMAEVPDKLPGSVSIHLGALLSHRQTLWSFPLPFEPGTARLEPGASEQATWALVDAFEAAPQPWLPVEPARGLANLLARPDWQVVDHVDGVLLLRYGRPRSAEAYRLERTRLPAAAASSPAEHGVGWRELELEASAARLRARLVLACSAPEPGVVVVRLEGATALTRVLDWMSWMGARQSADPCAGAAAVEDRLEMRLPPESLPARVTIGLYRLSERYPLATEPWETGPWFTDAVIWQEELGELRPGERRVWTTLDDPFGSSVDK